MTAAGTTGMPTVVALLRGVNVGGAGKVPMAELRRLAEQLGLEDARTYMQSGNLLVSDPRPGRDLAAELEAAMAATFDLSVRVILRTAAEMTAVASANPFAQGEPDPRRLHVVFLSEPPDEAAVAALDPNRSPPDVYAISGSHVYLHLPNGMGRTKLSLGYLERTLRVAGTARNWNTVRNLIDMMAG